MFIKVLVSLFHTVCLMTVDLNKAKFSKCSQLNQEENELFQIKKMNLLKFLVKKIL